MTFSYASVGKDIAIGNWKIQIAETANRFPESVHSGDIKQSVNFDVNTK